MIHQVHGPRRSTRNGSHVRLAALATAALISLACGGSEPARPSDTDSSVDDSSVDEGDSLISDAAVDPRTVEMATIREANDGRLPFQDALDLFASVFGEIPGGDPSRFDLREGDGTMAIAEVAGYWNEMTAEQQQAIEALLLGSKKSTLLSSGATPADSALQAAIEAARAAITAQVGADVPFPIIGFTRPGLTARPAGETEVVPVAGVAVPVRDGELARTGLPAECRVYFNSDEEISATLVAHEVFHCFQFALGTEVMFGAQAWLREGMAEWAGNEIGGIDPRGTQNFLDWTLTGGSLYAMAYEAIGLYWVLESLGASPWLMMDEMIRAGGGIAPVAASGLDPADVLARAATAPARAGSIAALPVSAAWDYGISGIPDFVFRSVATASPTAPYEFERGHGEFSRYELPLLQLEGGTRVQVSLTADVGILEFFGQEPIEWQTSLVREFCLEEGGCTCGVEGAVGELPQGTRDVILTGGELDGGNIQLNVRIPDIAFTDGSWAGTITSTDLAISSGSGAGARPETQSAIEFTIEDGVVTSGIYTLAFPGTFESPLGLIDGMVSINGVVTGCGYSPELVPASVAIDATMQFPTGDTGPVQVVIDVGAQTMTIGVPVGPPVSLPFSTGGDFDTYGSMWVLQPGSTPNHRLGLLDATAELAFMGAAGFAVSNLAFTFDISGG